MTNLTKHLLSVCLLATLAACQSGSRSPTDSQVYEGEPADSVSEPVLVQRNVPLNKFELPAASDMGYENLWHRIIAGFQLYDHYSHPDVQRESATYNGSQEYFDRISLRAEPFLFWMVEEAERRRLPTELVLLPFIESAFDPTAASSERAVGLWQFVAPTATMLGLQRDSWYDGRRDPLASTRAAFDYLESLYNQFNQDWLLALAAYNAGEGNMRRALRNKPSAQFWDLRLPGETQTHVPRLLALASVLAHAESYELVLPKIANSPYFTIVDPGFQVDLSVAAEAAGLDVAVLQALNPGYLQFTTHPYLRQGLLVPKQTGLQFAEALARIPADQRIAWDRYEIRPGDTLSSISRRLGISIEMLQKVNNLTGSKIIAGHFLLIPGSANLNPNRLPVLAALDGANPPSQPESYQVRRGDNLWSIARRFGLRSQDIAEWNNIALDAVLHPGQLLLLGAVKPVPNGNHSPAN